MSNLLSQAGEFGPYPKRLAVIDLGTNTFHLLIVDVLEDHSFREIYREPEYVYLAEDGIQKIGNAPFKRGLDTMIRFAERLKEYKVIRTIAFGTEGLRKSSNSNTFRAAVKESTGIDVQVISGEEEARLIAAGTRLALPPLEEMILVMDIGGGSVEFIFMDGEEVHWKKSFPVGISVLHRAFHREEPIPDKAISELRAFLDRQLADLRRALKQYPVRILGGASGSFEVVEAALKAERLPPHYSELDSKDFLAFSRPFYKMNLEERLSHPLIPKKRAQLFVAALLLIEWALEATEASTIWISSFAMKEGMLSEMALK